MKAYLKKFAARAQAGDTIVEVLISVCILSVVLAGSYVVANHSLQTGTESAQRSEALALAQQQIEYIKNASINNQTLLDTYTKHLGSLTSDYCIVSDGASIKSGTDPLCQQGSGKQYKITTTYGSLVFTVTATWETAYGGVSDVRCPSPSQPCDRMTLYYKLAGSYLDPEAQVFSPPPPSDIGNTSVKLSGKINPNGNSYDYYFQYVVGTTDNFSAAIKTPVQSLGFSNNIFNPVSASILNGLSPATSYSFQLCLKDSICSSTGYFKTKAPPTINNFSVSSDNTQVGTSVTIHWKVTNVTSCTASGDWSWGPSFFSDGVDNSQPVTPTSNGPKTYSLKCWGTDGSSTTSNASVYAWYPPTITGLAVSPNPVAAGSAATITWTVNNSNNGGWCTWPDNTTTTSGKVVYPSSTTSYTFTCYGYNYYPIQATATVTVAPLPSITITVYPAVPAWHSAGGGPCPYGTNNYTRCSATWVATNATSCTLYNSSGAPIASPGTNHSDGTNSGGQIGAWIYGTQQGVAGWDWGSLIHLKVSCAGDGGNASQSWYWSYGVVSPSPPSNR